MKPSGSFKERPLPEESKGEAHQMREPSEPDGGGNGSMRRTAADDLLKGGNPGSLGEEAGSAPTNRADASGADLGVVNTATPMDSSSDQHLPTGVRSIPVSSARRRNGAGAARGEKEDGPNAAELVRAIEAEIGDHVCCRDRWYKYADGRFALVDPHEYLPVVLNLLPEEKRLRRVADELMLTYEGLKQVPGGYLRGLYAFGDDEETVVLNCANGVLHVTADTVRLVPHSPDHGFTSKLCAAYRPEASQEKMTAAVQKFLPDREDQALFNWWSGYTLLPAIRVRLALANIGQSHTGKTTLWEYGIGSVFPKEAKRSLSLAEICNQNGYFVATLPGSALNLGGELTQTELLSSEKFKLLVGGEDVPARAIRGEPFTLSGYTTKFIFLGNHLPRFCRGSDAEASRLCYLFFDQVSEKPDKSLQEQLKTEAEGVFSCRMVPALQRILAGEPCPAGGAKSRALHQRFAVLNDPFEAFMDEWCCLDATGSADKDDLAAAYQQFAEHHDLTVHHKDALMKVLRERYPQLTSGRETVEGARNRVMKGIRLKKLPGTLNGGERVY